MEKEIVIDRGVILDQTVRLQVVLTHLSRLHELVATTPDLNNFRETIKASTVKAFSSTSSTKDVLDKLLERRKP